MHALGRRHARRIVGLVAVTAATLPVAACVDAASDTSSQEATDVTVPADGLDLVGTLRLPDGPGPHPGIVIAHGSGPQSRDGLVTGQLGLGFPRPVPVYEQLAKGLREAGFAVLTFDKRSCGPFNSCADNGYPPPPSDASFGTFVNDVDRVVDHLAQHSDVDRTIVLGHSKGGTVAATLAGQRDDLAALVLLATPAISIDEVITAQAATFADLVNIAGQSAQPEAVEAVEGLRQLADDVSGIADGEVDGPPVDGVPRAFWASWVDASRAAPASLEVGEAPVLVLGGGSDLNVLPEQVEAWGPVLTDADELDILPGITHALTRLEVDDPAAITPSDVGLHVDGILIDRIVEWLHARTG